MTNEAFDEMLDAMVYLIDKFNREIMESYSLTKQEFLEKHDEFMPFILAGIEALLAVNYGEDNTTSFLKEFAERDANVLIAEYL